MANLAEALDADDAVATSDAHSQIVDFLRGYSAETTPVQADRLGDFTELFAPGTTINVTFLPGSAAADTVRVCTHLHKQGFEPVPHFAARSFHSRAAFEDMVARVAGEAGVTEALVIGGGVSTPAGPFSSSMQLLESGVFDRHGITRIGVAGHPEGTPDINRDAVAEALAWKNAFAERTGADMYIVTQFVFDARPVIAWDRALRAAGNRLPVHIGVPGPASLRGLIGFAKACGVGPSLRVLTRRATTLTKLAAVQTPDRLVAELAAYKAGDPDCSIEQVHLYPLGGLKRAADWARAVVAGRFTLKPNGSGFDVDPDG